MRKMKRQICIEETVSRIPSLFAYYGYNELGEIVLHKATDDIDGSYGKMVSGIKAPKDLTLEGSVVIKNGETVSYRTLMNYYYEAKNKGLKPKNDNSLISFVELGIGKIEIKVKSTPNNEGVTEYYYETPDGDRITFDVKPVKIEPFIYISQARKLYNEMAKKMILCHEFWREQETEDVREPFETKEICCICDDYNERGGDGMVQILAYWIAKAEEVAEQFFSYTDNEKDNFTISISLVNTYNDPGYYTPYIINWKPGYYLAPKEKFIYEDKDGVMQMYQVGNQPYTGTYNEDNERPEFDENDVTKIESQWEGITKIEIHQKTDSKLKSLRRFSNYIDVYGEQHKPDENEDWLYYYCKDFVLNIRTKNDELGNIGFYGDTPVTVGNSVVNLMAYGDMITDIQASNGQLTFTYVIGAHLKGIKANPWVKYDDDENTLYYYSDFEVDTDSEYSKNCGVFYTETYYYDENGDLAQLLENPTEWNKYLTNENDVRRFDVKNYPFYVGNGNESYDMQVGTESAKIDYLITDLTYIKDNKCDIFTADIFKEDYLMGVHFKPYVEDNVDIDRGKNAAFERHIKLGEVKTLQDLENYQNGGFFNIKDF